MYLPPILNSATGLHFDNDKLYVVTLWKIGQSIHIRSRGVETVSDGDLVGAVHRLLKRRLIKKFVCTHVPIDAVQVLMEQMPLVDDDEYRRQCESTQEERIGKEGALFRHSWIEDEEDQSILVTGAVSSSLLDDRVAFLRAAGIEPLHIGILTEGAETLSGLEPEYGLSAELAKQGLYEDKGAIYFWDGQNQENSRNLRGRVEAFKLIVAIGGMLVLVLSLLMGLRLYMGAKVQAIENELVPHQTRTAMLSREKTELAHLRSRVEESDALVNGRTNVAFVLAHLARVTPEGLWFDALRVDEKGGRSLIAIEGCTKSEVLVTQFMRHIEIGGVLGEVHLVEAKGELPLESEPSTGADRLTTFEIIGVSE